MKVTTVEVEQVVTVPICVLGLDVGRIDAYIRQYIAAEYGKTAQIISAHVFYKCVRVTIKYAELVLDYAEEAKKP